MQTVYHAEAKLQAYRTKDLVMTLLVYADQTHRTISDLSAMQTVYHAEAKLQTYRTKDLLWPYWPKLSN